MWVGSPTEELAAGRLHPRYQPANQECRNLGVRQGYWRFLLGSPSDASINGVALLTFQRNSAGVYALQKVQGPDIGVNFPASETSSLRADGRPVNDMQVIVAQVMR